MGSATLPGLLPSRKKKPYKDGTFFYWRACYRYDSWPQNPVEFVFSERNPICAIVVGHEPQRRNPDSANQDAWPNGFVPFCRKLTKGSVFHELLPEVFLR
jgi:hypothetical protein